MAKLRNRIRRFVVDGRPAALGVVAVGDAHTCTNPLYGRGCSLAMVHAELLADAARRAPHALDDAFHLAFEAATAETIEPWYRASVNQDRAQRAEAAPSPARGRAATPPPPEDDDPEAQQRQLHALGAARGAGARAADRSRAVFRAFLRGFNLLESPEALMQDTEVMAKVLEACQARDEREPDPPLGPDRAELLALFDDLDPAA